MQGAEISFINEVCVLHSHQLADAHTCWTTPVRSPTGFGYIMEKASGLGLMWLPDSGCIFNADK